MSFPNDRAAYRVDPQIPTRLVAASDADGWVKLIADRVCDGVSDEEDVNWAIDDLPAALGEVALSEGTFAINNPLLADRAGLTLSGRGYSTHLRVNNNRAVNCIEVSADAVTVKDLRIDGNADNNPTAGNEDLQNGIYFNAAGSNSMVMHCWIHQCRQTGIHVDGDVANHLNISGCNFYEDKAWGIRGVGDWSVISNCTFDSCGNGGVWAGQNQGALKGCTFYNCSIGVATSGSMWAITGNTFGECANSIQVSTNYNAVSGNEIYMFHNIGIDVTGNYNTIGPNTIHQSSNTNGDLGNGIEISGDENAIIGNNVQSNHGTGINIAAAADRTLVDGNISLHNTVAQYTNAGTNTSAGTNIFV